MNRCSGVQRWSLAPRRLSASPEARADNRPWVGRRYLRPRPINPITGWESSGAGALFLGNQISGRSGHSSAVLARVEAAALLLFQFASASGKINEGWVKFSRTTLQ